MKYIFILLSFLMLIGCTTKHTDIIQNQQKEIQHTGSINEKTAKNINITGTVLSGIYITGEYISIINKDSTVVYNNLVSLNIPPEYKDREYDLSHSPINIYPNIFFGIKDKKTESTISITFNLRDSINKSRSNLCLSSNNKKQTKLIKGDQIYYLNYTKFTIDKFEPSDTGGYNYQSEICFIKNDKIYYITISNPTHYRKDIVDSLKFL